VAQTPSASALDNEGEMARSILVFHTFYCLVYISDGYMLDANHENLGLVGTRIPTQVSPGGPTYTSTPSQQFNLRESFVHLERIEVPNYASGSWIQDPDEPEDVATGARPKKPIAKPNSIVASVKGRLTRTPNPKYHD
jgi:hypothetical protein